MTNFEEACKMSAEKWVASFPDEVEAHKFSQKHIDAINEIIYPKPAVKVKKLSKKTVRFIIIAAVLLALATTDRKSTRLNSSHIPLSRMPSSA